MSKRQREIFLTVLLSDLLSQYPKWHIDDHCKIEWRGQPRNLWPEADLIIDAPTGRFIVEYDEDSDPCRSLIKYWPLIHQTGRLPFTLIGIWRRGPTIGRGYAELAKWAGARLMDLYPTFVYKFVERTDEKAIMIAREVAQIVEATPPINSQSSERR